MPQRKEEGWKLCMRRDWKGRKRPAAILVINGKEKKRVWLPSNNGDKQARWLVNEGYATRRTYPI